MGDFVHLRVHSEYSLLDGACRIEQLIDRVKELGMSAVALTDHSALYGVVPFYKACKQKGIKPIIGVELIVSEETAVEKNRQTLVLLAENHIGYKNLLRLVTEAHLHLSIPSIQKHHLLRHRDGIIAIASMKDGEFHQCLAERDFEGAYQNLQKYWSIFGKDNFFLEISYHGLEEEMMLCQQTLRFAREAGALLVATNDVYYLNQEDSVAQDILRCIGSGTLLTDPKRKRLPNTQFFLKAPQEMHQLFPYAKDAIENAVQIANRCTVELSLGEPILPEYPLPPGQSAHLFLRDLCFRGLQKRYGNPSEEARERMEYELSVIEKMGFSDYFLIVWDFMHFAHEQKILTGPGRGSAAGSLVAYALSITNIDPLQYKLLFERFLNPERISMPDIDIDFEVERRNEVIRYVTEKYGADHVAQIITFGTMAARAAIRDVGRVLNVPAKLVDTAAKLIQSGSTIMESLEQSTELKQVYDEDEQVQRLVDLARKIEGFPRHVSTHAAGIVISRQPLTEYVSLQTGNEGFSLTQFAMEDLEQVGLLKMDFLGLRNLTILDQTIQLIQADRGITIELNQIPHDDPKTFNLLSRGDSTGIFQLESAGMRRVLREVAPTRFEDIIAILALYRPGPMEIIPSYAATKNGSRSVSYIHPDLEPILSDTYGFILYQEQIMQIAAKMAGYSLGQADVLRRAVSKKKREILEEQRATFVSGCISKGYSERLGDQVYDLIVRFADYGFNRSHSAAYSLIAYEMAYLKANYPCEFMTALLSMSIGNPEKIAEYVEEAKRKKIEICPPDINHSESAFSIKGGKILFALTAIKHVGTHAIRNILEEREKNGPFLDLFDFCRRIDLRVCNRRVIEVLIQSGTMDSLPRHRVQKLSILDRAIERGGAWQREHANGQVSLFDNERSMGQVTDEKYPDIPPFTARENLDFEKELLGLYVSGHPLDEYDHVYDRKEVIPINEINLLKNRDGILIAGQLVEVRTITTKKGEAMAFALLEDKWSQIEIILFPNVHRQFSPLIKKGKLLVLKGKVEIENEGKCKLIVQKVWDMATLPKQESNDQEKMLFIQIVKSDETPEKLRSIQQILLRYPGNSDVCLYYASRKEVKKLQEKYRVQVSEDLIEQLRKVVGEDSVSTKVIKMNEK